ncbi:MAG TPA: hypothetical protein VN840_18825 [Streptosporangiaceae bacterium]|nr:hypothetical protein [Streptosporangiaceae bacterium]
MSAPPRKDEPGLTRRDELTVSGAALSEVPWKTAAGAGVVVAGGDLLLHLSTLHVGLSSSLSAGVVAFGAVAGAGVLLKDRPSRAIRWARRNPWRFAVLPGAATAIVVYVLSVIIGSSGLLGGGFTALWHGAIAYGVTGAAGAIAGGRRRST